jgi:hypothetical protein
MIIRRLIICCILLVSICYTSFLFAQEKKLEKLRVGGGSTSAMQMSLWLAKEANYYEKYGLNVVRELDQSGFIKSLLPNR